MNPNQVHFSRVRASELLLIDANDPETIAGRMRPIRPHGGCTAASIALSPMRAASCMCIRSTPPCSPALADSRLPPIDQNSATFFNRHVVDEGYAGLAFEDEGERCASCWPIPRTRSW